MVEILYSELLSLRWKNLTSSSNLKSVIAFRLATSIKERLVDLIGAVNSLINDLLIVHSCLFSITIVTMNHLKRKKTIKNQGKEEVINVSH